MSGSMRSRFNAEPPRPARFDPPDGERGSNPIVQILFGAAILILGGLSVAWLLGDISGDYSARDPQLGIINLTLIRRPTNFAGRIAYGNGAALEVTAGGVKGTDVDLTFALPQQWIDAGQQPRNATLKGRIEGSNIHGVLSESGYTFDITLIKDDLSSLYRKVQSHLPWAT